jgi:hypothetical protein
MPRFYLHIRTGDGVIEDEEGVDFPDHATAIAEAVRGARCLMTGEVTEGTLCLDQSIEVHDAAGQHLTSVPFTEALTLVTAPELLENHGRDGRFL